MAASTSLPESKESKATVHAYSLDYDGCMCIFAAAFFNPNWIKDQTEWRKAFKETCYVIQQISQSIKDADSVELLNGSNRQDLKVDFENRFNKVETALKQLQQLRDKKASDTKITNKLNELFAKGLLTDWGSVFRFLDEFIKFLNTDLLSASEKKVNLDKFSLADFQSESLDLKDGGTYDHAFKSRVTYKFPGTADDDSFTQEMTQAEIDDLKKQNLTILSIDTPILPIYHFNKAQTLKTLFDKYLFDSKCPSWKFDDTKISLLYAQMHHLAEKHKDKKIILHFMDDRKEICDVLTHFYKNNPHLMPDNVTLKITHYQPHLDVFNPKTLVKTDKPIITQEVKGEGKFDADFKKHTTVLYHSLDNSELDIKFGKDSKYSLKRTDAVAEDFNTKLKLEKLPSVKDLPMFKDKDKDADVSQTSEPKLTGRG